MKRNHKNIARNLMMVRKCRHLAGKLAAAFFLVALAALGDSAAQAVDIATVDQFDGYSNRVLEKIVNKWSPPQVDGDWLLRLQVSLDENGKVTGCKVLRSSGYTSVDTYACQAFRGHAAFGTPPYGMPVETYFALWSGNKSQASQNDQKKSAATSTQVAANSGNSKASAGTTASYKTYLDASAKKIRNSIYVPAQTKPGTYKTTTQIKCDASGNILSASIVKGSGDSLVDKYVLQGIKRAKAISPPPKGLGNPFVLTFTLKR